MAKARRDRFETSLKEHRTLRDLMDDLERFLDKPRPGPRDPAAPEWAADRGRRLVLLHGKLSALFRNEEEALRQWQLAHEHPRYTRRLQTLFKEHAQMLGDLRAILAAALVYAEGTVAASPRLRQWTGNVLQALRKHESRETTLIQSALYEDLGTGD